MTAPALQVARSCPYAPPAQHVEMRESAGITRVQLPSGREAWAVSRLDLIRTMLSDPRFSSDRDNPGYPSLSPEPGAPPSGGFRKMMIQLDPPEHGPVRRGVISEFTIRRVAGLKPRIQQIVDERVDAMLAGPRPVDLVPALSLAVPSLVICELLGVPYTDHDFFQTRTAAILRRDTPAQERRATHAALRDYLTDLVGSKAREPGDDVLSRQLARGAEPADVVALAFLLLVAGHETTANMISLGVLSLLERPRQLAELVADPARMPVAVEELLRYFTIVEYGNSRVATADVELGGVLIRAGEGVVSLSNTADHDPEVFSGADELRLDRGARHHLAFGFGPHQCLGQNLARAELDIVFTTLFRRVPTLRLAVPAGELPFKSDATIYGIHRLPVTWDA
ncbi:cytochrome P450 [Actinoplanes sp. NPDC049265]|uniref:cytochrome P450 n=1 Tax=Actinoplanes sp. NPDC049265 TaxID=3363902 RepID=UPI0037231B9E